ncbi:MAG TPA: diguanylate cyclase [Pyrinomonadaceae bacterium]|nr:diguanylate cyclase [Pyrinomonadaceae bacterium]
MPRRKQETRARRSGAKAPRAVSVESHEIVQEHPEDAPAGWLEAQDKLANSHDLSLLLVDGRQPPAIAISNNNSICRAFQTSPEHVRLCDPYCGDAHRRALSAGSLVHYKCHAGLECFTMPVEIAGEGNLAVIGGRAFLSGADYRSLAERFRDGELNELLDSAPFANVIFSEPQRLTQLASLVAKAAQGVSSSRAPQPIEASEALRTELPVESEAPVDTPTSQSNVSLPIETQSDLQGEVERLRDELQHRADLADSLKQFLERITSNEPEQTYLAILTHAKRLLGADRASLMVLNEDANELVLKAAFGLPVNKEQVVRVRVGQGIAGRVVESGQPLVVANAAGVGGLVADPDRDYKTASFISYPISMRGRKLGVLNLTDKTNGKEFDDVDLSLLDLVGPQIAIALERAEWQDRATQFQLMSITDPLTGLLNRRYLEERLTEELNRSLRYNYSMSCLMIDIDDFKRYNDLNGHQAGDDALKITAHCLKAALRSADVACRYGGEEFCVLLPQTSLTEAGVIAERMRQRVAETVFPYGKSQPLGVVSISVGISTFTREIDSAEKIIATADRALYRAKHGGKNRVEYYVENLNSAPANK